MVQYTPLRVEHLYIIVATTPWGTKFVLYRGVPLFQGLICTIQGGRKQR